MKPLRQKQEEAAERRKARDKRTPEEQLARLDAILGTNLGAKRERARLFNVMKERDAKAQVEKTAKKKK